MGIGSIIILVFINIKLTLNHHHHNDDHHQFNVQTVDITEFGDDRSRASHGTELVVLEGSYHDQKTYKFEDFFWTGSGDDTTDGFDEEYLWSTQPATTIYQTKTVTSTVYTQTEQSSDTRDSTITPSPTRSENEIDDDYGTADREFWLLTVLKSHGKDPVIIDLKNSLAKLYKTAFQRQQEQHLGITRNKRETIDKRIDEKPVKVYIHGIEKIKSSDSDDDIQVLYHVTVAGKPVAAITAAQDMSLVSDEEVTNELGYPFVIKAEPYLKEAQSQSLSERNNTWIFIGVSIIGLLVLLLLVAFVSLSCTKRKRPTTATGLDNRQQIFERGVIPKDTLDYRQPPQQNSPTYINYEDQPITTTQQCEIPTKRPQSSISSKSSSSLISSSSTSLDISPLMGVKKHRLVQPKKPQRPKAALNKTAPLRTINPSIYSSASSKASKRDSPDTIYVEDNNDPGVMSPKSFLSMPSVKSFPRGSMPEPLNKVLEPVSVLHLDISDDGDAVNDGIHKSRQLIRHGSVGAVEDPGVIGPIVWNMHQQRLQHGVSVDEGIDDLTTAPNISRMRKRFHNLLDDTFSLFGSRKQSPVDERTTSPPRRPPPPIEVKSHSAIEKRNDDGTGTRLRPRPKTSQPHLDHHGNSRPKGAWESVSPSPLIRPSTADLASIKRPKINVDQVLAEGRFKINDPAVPLIAAIKSEIERCSLPGSTSDVRL